MFRYVLLALSTLVFLSCQKKEETTTPQIVPFFSFETIEEMPINENQEEELWQSTGWGVYEDIIFPGTTILHETTHDEDRFGYKTLKCQITGGDAYNNAFFTNTVAYRWEGLEWFFEEISEFEYNVRFYPEVEIDCEIADLSEVEGFEFTFQHVIIPYSWGWGVQWSKTNTWSYWDDQRVNDKPIGWVNLQGIDECINANDWNTLKLVGTSRNDQVHYLNLEINGIAFPLDIELPKGLTPDGWAENFLQVGFQINGNTAIRNDHNHGVDPVTVYLDNVNLELGKLTE